MKWLGKEYGQPVYFWGAFVLFYYGDLLCFLFVQYHHVFYTYFLKNTIRCITNINL